VVRLGAGWSDWRAFDRVNTGSATAPWRFTWGIRSGRPNHQEDDMDKKAKVPKKAKSTTAGKGKADTVKK
jgi:hypothetical protein